jgi:hypothetical protein
MTKVDEMSIVIFYYAPRWFEKNKEAFSGFGIKLKTEGSSGAQLILNWFL